MSNDSISLERFKIMERKLYNGIMTPSAVFAILSGFYLLTYYGFEALWIKIKLALVAILFFYHIICYKYLKLFKEKGLKGMYEYWDHIRIEENCDMDLKLDDEKLELRMNVCPSLSKVLDNDCLY